MKTQNKKILAFGFPVMLFIAGANAIWCHNCKKTIPSQRCPHDQEFCWAGEGAACYTENLYIGRTRIKSNVGCYQNCYNGKADYGSMWNELVCCFTEYCNI